MTLAESLGFKNWERRADMYKRDPKGLVSKCPTCPDPARGHEHPWGHPNTWLTVSGADSAALSDTTMNLSKQPDWSIELCLGRSSSVLDRLCLGWTPNIATRNTTAEPGTFLELLTRSQGTNL